MLQHQKAFICTKNFIFQLFEFGRYVAFSRGKRLLADKTVRYTSHIAAAYLDIIAKDLVETDFQLGNPGFFLEFGFHLRQVASAAVHDIPQFIYLGIIPFADCAAILEIGGWVIHKRTVD